MIISFIMALLYSSCLSYMPLLFFVPFANFVKSDVHVYMSFHIYFQQKPSQLLDFAHVILFLCFISS